MGVRSSSTSSMADMGLATREDDHGDRIEPERERWGGAGLHRGGATGVVRCRRRSEDALVARVHDVEEAEEEDEDVDDGVEAIHGGEDI